MGQIFAKLGWEFCTGTGLADPLYSVGMSAVAGFLTVP